MTVHFENLKLPEIFIDESHEPNQDLDALKNSELFKTKAFDGTSQYFLTFKEDRLSILFENQKPIFVDCSDSKILTYIKKTNRKNTFCRALGLKQNRDHLIDMTTGFAKDSFVVSKYFKKVTWIERNPIVFLLLKDGLRRLKNTDEATASKFNLIMTDANSYLNNDHSFTNAVLYFDFMFNDKKAKSNKEMVFLKHITSLDGDDDVSELITKAKNVKPQRIVLKAKKISQDLMTKQDYIGQTVNYYVV